SSGAARHLLPLRRRRAASGRCGRDLTDEALLPFTGEGARRADEGARAQRRVLLMLPGRARAARFARALIRRFAPPSPASQEKGCFRTERQGPDGEALFPLRRRRADPDPCGERWGGSPSPVYGRRCPEGG